MNTFTRAQLAQRGVTDSDIRRLVGEGSLARVRRGDYLDTSTRPVPQFEDRHRILVQATWPRLHSGVLSHHSAAALHGLPLPSHDLGRVHVTRVGDAGGVRRASVQVHRARLDDVEVTEVDGLPVTTLERTAADLARILTPDRGLVVVDAALRQGADPVLLAEIVEMQGRGRADFAWPDLGVLGEFDGWVKYGRLLKPGQQLSDVLRDERFWEERMRSQGWWVHRWTDPGLRVPAVWSKGLEQALHSGRPW